MYNGRNEYVTYMQRTKRSLNDHRKHFASQMTDSVSFVSWVKNLAHNFMMPLRNVNNKKKNAAKGRGRGRKPRGLGEGNLIFSGSNFLFQYFGGYQEDIFFFSLFCGGGGWVGVWWNCGYFRSSPSQKLDYFWELFLSILGRFLKIKIQN